MNGYFHFILDSGTSLGLLTLIYLVFLKKETCFRFNRVYLIASVLFSVIFPFITIPVQAPPVQTAGSVAYVVIERVPAITQTYTAKFTSLLTEYGYVGLIYLGGTGLFLLLFIARLVSLTCIVHKSEEVYRDHSFVLLRGRRITSPFSFFRFIFIPAGLTDSEKLDRILIHEKEHVRQKHSIDIILLQLFSIVLWCNPFVWIISRLVRENHEFLADKAVLSKGFSSSGYKMLLLSQAVGHDLVVTNNFNYSLVKNRIRMMSRKSSVIALVRGLTGVVLGVLLLISFRLQADTLDYQSLLGGRQVMAVSSFLNRILGLEKNENSLLGLSAGYGKNSIGPNQFVMSGNKKEKMVMVATLAYAPPVQKPDIMARLKTGDRLYVARSFVDKYGPDPRLNNSIPQTMGSFNMEALVGPDGKIIRGRILNSSVQGVVDKDIIKFYTDTRNLKSLAVVAGKKNGKPVLSKFVFPVTVLSFNNKWEPINALTPLPCSALRNDK